jgi:hypothetical protein
MAKLLKNNGLTFVLLMLFAFSIIGQWVAGWNVTNEELREHGKAAMTLASYTTSPAFLSAVFENWESEFLQMAMYVFLTGILVQRGSAESKDPNEAPRDQDLASQAYRPGAPRVLRAGRLARAIYSRSLFLALAALFIVSFVIHWTQSARVAARQAIDHGVKPPTILGYGLRAFRTGKASFYRPRCSSCSRSSYANGNRLSQRPSRPHMTRPVRDGATV